MNVVKIGPHTYSANVGEGIGILMWTPRDGIEYDNSGCNGDNFFELDFAEWGDTDLTAYVAGVGIVAQFMAEVAAMVGVHTLPHNNSIYGSTTMEALVFELSHTTRRYIAETTRNQTNEVTQ